VQGFYVNEDEKAFEPTRGLDGFTFEGKDLIHHATGPFDLADIKTHTGSFIASAAGKVVLKMETSAPYSTIVQNADGKFWSTAMTYEQVGGQGNPVEQVADLVGKPTKPGKAQMTEATKVVTFGVGYWVEPGSTVVSSITFHGVVYDLTCKATPSASASASSTVKPTASASASASARPSGSRSASTSATPSSAVIIGAGNPSTSLPVTGPGSPLGIILVGAGVILAGGALLLFTRRRKTSFKV
jgi:LPXTG-motif cell wall-anchored protein